MPSPETDLPWLDELLGNPDFVQDTVEALKTHDELLRNHHTTLNWYIDVLLSDWEQPETYWHPLKQLIVYLLEQYPKKNYYDLAATMLTVASRYSSDKFFLKILEDWLFWRIEQQFSGLDFIINELNRRKYPQFQNYIKTHYLVPLLQDEEQLPDPYRERGITKLVTSPINYEIKKLTLQRLTKFSSEYSAEIAEAWLYSRHPDLEDLLLQLDWTNLPPARDVREAVIFLALKTNQLNRIQLSLSFDAIHLGKALKDRDPVVVVNAQTVIQSLSDADLNTLASNWSVWQTEGVFDLLVLRGYLPKKDAVTFNTYLLVMLKMNRLQTLVGINNKQVQFLITAFTHQDQEIAKRAYQLAGQLTDPKAQAALCEAVIEKSWPELEQVVKKAGFAPLELPRKALFYFLTEQWEAYERIDFDYSILRIQYQTASPIFKKRLATKIRIAGRLDYIDILRTGTVGLAPLEQVAINGTDVSLLVELLEQQGQWAQLWSLVGSVTLYHSRYIVQKLQQVGWQPPTESERALLAELAGLLAGPMEIGLSKVRRLLTAEQWSDLDWAGWLAQPLGKRGPADLTALLTFRAKGWRLPGELQATLIYLETLLRYRLLYSIELVEESAEPGEFDIEL